MNRIKNSAFDVAIRRAVDVFVDQVMLEVRGIILSGLENSLPAQGSAARVAPKTNAPAVSGRRKARDGRLPRRSAKDITRGLERVQKVLEARKEPMRAEQIRVELRLQRKELPRILKQGLATGVLRSTGQKRATSYSLVAASAAPRSKPIPAPKKGPGVTKAKNPFADGFAKMGKNKSSEKR